MPTLKIVLLGDLSVGKSSLVNRFAAGSFDPHLPNTIGAAFISKEHILDNRKVKFEIWDTAGQERYKSLTPMYYRNAKVALVCFDLSNAETSFERAKYWVDQLLLLGPPDIEVRIIGTKSDVAEVEAPPFVTEYCGDHGLLFVTTSAKLGQGVDAIFDSIVEGLPEEAFQQLELEAGEGEPENVLLRMPGRGTGCC